jgi:chemotaxis protein methyltransferase CheR
LSPPAPAEADPAEVGRLLEIIRHRFGYDFAGYQPGSLARRIQWLKSKTGLLQPGALEQRVAQDDGFFPEVLDALTIDVSAMFRDPPFFQAFRRVVVPFLRTYPRPRLWVAGCARGEEAYSLAIVLREEGLEDRSLLYATDINPAAIERAREGIYPLHALRGFGENYLEAGGRASFAGYFTVAHGYAAIDPSLRKNICFAHHNLAADRVFGEMQFVCCRNVLIYFGGGLQRETVRLLDDSLAAGGFMGIGAQESLATAGLTRGYQELESGRRLYRKLPVV